MTNDVPVDYDVLTPEEYLLDPPSTVWQGLLLADHAAWLDTRETEIVRMAEEAAREVGPEIPREAWLGLYSPASQLEAESPEGLGVAHSIFRRAEGLAEWTSLRVSVSADEVAAVFGAAHFVRELLQRLPSEVKEDMKAAARANATLEDVRATARDPPAARDRRGDYETRRRRRDRLLQGRSRKPRPAASSAAGSRGEGQHERRASHKASYSRY